MPHPYPYPELKPLFELNATLERFDDLGETPHGHRMLAVVGQGSGSISGDRVRGQVLRGSGGDWLLLRRDGEGQLDVRITIKTDDEALIYMRYEGILAGDALPRVLVGEAVAPTDYYFRTTTYSRPARIRAWLNKIVAVGVGQVDCLKAGSVTESTRLAEPSTSTDGSACNATGWRRLGGGPSSRRSHPGSCQLVAGCYRSHRVAERCHRIAGV